MGNLIKNLTVAGLILFNPLMSKVKAEVKGNVEYIRSQENQNSYARLNAFYSLPKEISGFSLGEFYKNGDGYFGVSFLEKPVWNNISSRLRLEHDNEPLSEASMGASFSIPNLPKDIFAKISWDALWMNPKGKFVDKSVAGYFVETKLPHGFNLSTFAEFHLVKPEGITWKYGEINLGKKFGPFTLGYNPSLNSIRDGKLSPKFEHRVYGRVGF